MFYPKTVIFVFATSDVFIPACIRHAELEMVPAKIFCYGCIFFVVYAFENP